MTFHQSGFSSVTEEADEVHGGNPLLVELLNKDSLDQICKCLQLLRCSDFKSCSFSSHRLTWSDGRNYGSPEQFRPTGGKCCHISTQSFSFIPSSFRSSRWPGSGERKQYESSVQSHLHLLTQQLRESNILPSLVFSTVLALPPSSPPLATHLSSLRLMESRSIRFGDLSELVKVGRLGRT